MLVHVATGFSDAWCECHPASNKLRVSRTVQKSHALYITLYAQRYSEYSLQGKMGLSRSFEEKN